LLEGTGLRAVRVDNSTIRVVTVASPTHRPLSHEPKSGVPYGSSKGHFAYPGSTTGYGANLHQATDDPPHGDAAADGKPRWNALHEVVVTAQKYAQRELEVPISMDVIGGPA